MKIKNVNFYTLIAPFMVTMAICGFTLRGGEKKFFYLPLGFTGIYIMVEKEVCRRLYRKDLLRKIYFFQKSK